MQLKCTGEFNRLQFYNAIYVTRFFKIFLHLRTFRIGLIFYY